jgi:hypothetical protein
MTLRTLGPQDRVSTSPTHPTDRKTVCSNVCYFTSKRKESHLSKLRSSDQKDTICAVETTMSPQQQIFVTNESFKKLCLLIKKRLWEKVTCKCQILLGYVAQWMCGRYVVSISPLQTTQWRCESPRPQKRNLNYTSSLQKFRLTVRLIMVRNPYFLLRTSLRPLAEDSRIRKWQKWHLFIL